MLTHPISLLGWSIFGVGLLMLLSWVPTSVPGSGFGQFSQTVYNAHKAEISKAIMLFGAVLAVVGTMARGFELLADKIAVLPKDEVASADHSPEAALVVDGEVGDAQEVVLIKDRQGKDREVKIMGDGTAVVQTITGLKKFPSVDDAKAYMN